MLIFVKFEHTANAPVSINVTLSGIIMLIKLEQFSNAKYPIDVKVFGKQQSEFFCFISNKFFNPAKANLPI